jgi:single-strand DNA-binding protein
MYTTIIGNIGNDPEIRYLASGIPVANFSVAQQQRKRTVSGEWEDEEPLWLRVNVWREMAENVAETLHKGDRVVVTGKLHARTWTDDDGVKRSIMELEADEVGVGLRFATATITRTVRETPAQTQKAPQKAQNTAQKIRQAGAPQRVRK